MTADSRRIAPVAPADDAEHYVVSLEAYNAMANLVDAMTGVAQLASGGTIANAGGPDLSRVELGAMFRVFGERLNVQLLALPHRASRHS